MKEKLMGFRKAILVCILCLQGCQKGWKSETETPSDSVTRKYEGMGKLLGKDLILFGEEASDREKIHLSPYLWQAALDVLGFMGIHQASLETGLLETAWYTDPHFSSERFKVMVTIFGGRVSSEKVRVTVLCQKKKSSGQWEFHTPSESLGRYFEEKILLKARSVKSQMLSH
ncbi:MAG: DUF3576 domain-containing protein [Holosporales bacterium]